MLKILLVDDDTNVLEIYRKILEKENFQCITANNGLDAQKKIESQQFDLIITDLRMPEIAGHELVRILKKDKIECPIIIASSFIEVPILKEFGKTKTIDFLVKPFTNDLLLKKVKSLLSSSNVEQVNNEFINSFIDIAVKTLFKKVGSFVAQAPYTKQNSETGEDVSALVNFNSDTTQGSLSLSFNKIDYLEICERVQGTKHTEIDTENQNIIGEILNSIIVNTHECQTISHHKLKWSVPIIVVGASHSIQHGICRNTTVVKLNNSEFGGCKFEICVKNIH